MPLKISLIIPTKDGPRDLDICVDSIIQQSLLPDEVIIIDDGRLSCEFIDNLKTRIEIKGIAFIYIKKAVCGICKSRNIGAKQASYDILFYVDDDSVLNKDYIKNIMNIYNDDKYFKIGGVQGTVIENRNKKNKNIKDDIWSFLEVFFCIRSSQFGKILPSGFESSFPFEFSEIREVEYLSGGACSYRREVFEQYTFDERYEHPKGNSYREDSDFSYRVSKKYDLLFIPHAIVTNTLSSSSRLRNLDTSRLMIRNSFYFFMMNIPNKTLINYICFVWAIIGLLSIRLIYYIGHPRKDRFKEIQGILLGYCDIFRISRKNFVVLTDKE